MSRRRISVWIAVVAGLALAVGLLVVSSNAANAVSPASAVQAGDMWTSGWVPINPGQTLSLNHNLGGDPDDYVVELLFLDTAPGGFGINRRNF